MKSGELNRVAKSFAPLLPPQQWKQMGREFFRREGSWIQIIGFNPSRFAETYIPRTSFEFLKMPGPPTGGFLGQELQHANKTQRWVKPSEVPTDIFEEMINQFKPALIAPLHIDEIKNLLERSTEYWPHAYALCVMCVEAGGKEGAQHYFEAFLAATAGKPYPWVESRRRELTEILKLADAPPELRTRLATIEAEKLRALKYDGKL